MKKGILLALLVCHSAGAVKEYYSLSKSVRANGFGGAFYGLSDDEYALFYNPAGLNLYRGGTKSNLGITAGISTGPIASIPGAVDSAGQGTVSGTVTALQAFQGNPIHAGVETLSYYVTKHFAFGFLITDTKLNLDVLGRDFETTVDATAISDSGLFLGFARSLWDPNLHLGLTLKGLGRVGGHKTLSVSDILSSNTSSLDPLKMGGLGFGVDFDVGAIYDFPNPPLGIISRASMVVANFLSTNFPILRMEQLAGTLPGLPRLVSFGFYSVLPGYWWIDNFHLVADLAEIQLGGESNADFGARTGVLGKHLNLGVEMPMNGWFAPRVGFHQGYLSAGFGLNLRIMRLDFSTYAEELAAGAGRLMDRRVELRLEFGWSPPSPPPILTRTVEAPKAAEQTNLKEKPDKQKVKTSAESVPGPSPEPSPGTTPPPALESDKRNEAGKN